MKAQKFESARREASLRGNIIDAAITNVEVLSAQDFLKLMSERPEDIESSVFCPPKLGSSSFGSFKVKFLKSRLVPSL
jgi:hypothetical protein